MFSLALLLLPISGSAQAAIYSGNPEIWIDIDRPAHDFLGGSVILEAIQVHTCSGGLATYVHNVAIDPVAGWSTHVGGGDLCGITLVWGGDLSIQGPTYSLLYSVAATEIPIGTTIPAVALTPFSVVAGNYQGAAPSLLVTLIQGQ